MVQDESITASRMLILRYKLHFMLRLPFLAQCWLQFVGVSAAISGSLLMKEAVQGEDAGRSILSVKRSQIASNSSSPGGNSSFTNGEKGLIESITDEAGLTDAESSLIASIIGYAIAFGALLLLCCCFLCPSTRVRPASVASHQTDDGSVCSKAGFRGLLLSERMKILRQMFHPIVWSGSDEERGEKEEAPSKTHVTGVDILASSYAAINNRENSSLTTVDDTSHAIVCSICLNSYQPNCRIMTGNLCHHMFHWDCCMRWLETHDACPYCRQEFMTVEQFRQAALQVLGASRVRALTAPWLQPNNENTNHNNAAHLDQVATTDSLNPPPSNRTCYSSNQRDMSVRTNEQVCVELGRVASSEDET